MPDSKRFTDKIASWVEAAIEASGEHSMLWEVGVHPGPDGAPIVALAMWTSAEVIGKVIPLVITVGNPLLLNESTLATAVTAAIENGRQQRSARLTKPVPIPSSRSSLLLPT